MANAYISMLQLGGTAMMVALRAAFIPSVPRHTLALTAAVGAPMIAATSLLVPTTENGLVWRALDSSAFPWMPGTACMIWGVTCTRDWQRTQTLRSSAVPLNAIRTRRPTSRTTRVLVEVTRDSTEDYDRGEKLEHYKKIPTLEAVVIVSHREPRLEVWSRPAEGSTWLLNTARSGQAAHVPAVGCTLSVDAIWKSAAEPA